MNTKKLGAFLVALGLVLGIATHSAMGTVSSTTTQTITANGNGATTNYTIGFPFLDNNHIVVQREDTSVTPHTLTTIAQGVGAAKFTITGGDPGTTVVMGTAPTANQRLVIKRVTPKTQTVDYVETEAFPADDHEEAMDKDSYILQEMQRDVDSKIGLTAGSTYTTPIFPDPVADKFLLYNHAGTDLSLAPASGSIINNDVLKFNSGTNLWELYDMSALIAHLSDTANPHNVTAAQVGNAVAQWNANQIQGVTVNAAGIADGYALVYNAGTNRIVYSAGVPLLNPLTNGHIFVGSGVGIASDVAMSGDATIINTGAVTIANSAITNAKVAAAAGIAVSKLAAVTASRALESDASGFITPSSVTSTQMGYLANATSNLCGINQTCTLTSKTLTTPTSDIITFDDQASTPSNPSAGFYKLYFKSDGNLYSLNSAGAEIQFAAGSGLSSSLTDSHIYVGNGSNVATDVPVTGDVTIANTGATAIGAGKVTNSMLAGSIAASKLVGTDIATVGTITSGTWSGTAIANSKGGTGANSSASTGLAKVAAGTWSFASLVDADVSATAAIGQYKTASAIATKTAGYTVTASDDLLLCNTNSVTFTLPAAASNSGKVLRFKKIGSDANACTIARAGSDTIDGATSLLLPSQYDNATIVSDGTATWHVVASNIQVYASYYLSANSNAAHTNFDTKITDTHSAVTTGVGSWVFTAPRAGAYSISYNMLGGGSGSIQLYKNGSNYLLMGGVLSTTTSGASMVQLAVGDTIYLNNANGVTITGGTPSGGNGAVVSIYRVGN